MNADEEQDAELERGDLVHRYLVLDALGRGAMGVVYRAFDPELDRKVALKVLRASADDTTGRDRLLREAQALARLHHPSVVTIFDVGVFDDHVFLAMELIEGQTLLEALAEGPMPVGRAVELFASAGEGLAAAHRAGLTHRDFKPANVLIADDGRAKVVDFGLARPHRAPSSGPVGRSRLEVTYTDDPLSQSGSAAGTPAYMAPEVHAGEPADARADQYALCVSLFEAIAGRRPFADNTAADQSSRAKRAGGSMALIEAKRTLPELPRGLPRHIRALLTRGLAFDPAERFESMEELLSALRRDPAVFRRRLALVVGAIGLGALVQYGWGRATATGDDPCTGGRARWDGLWNAAQRDALTAALARDDSAYARDVSTRVGQRVDAYVDAWVARYEEVCRSSDAPTVLAARTTCLEHRRTDLAALLVELHKATPSAVERGVQAVPAVEDLGQCSAESALLAPVDPPAPQRAADVEAARARLAEAKALERTGQYEWGLEIARAALSDANATDYDPLRAEVEYQLGRMQELTGDFDGAVVSLQNAHWAAEGLRHERLAADAAVHLVFVTGVAQGNHEAALQWAEHARASIRRADDNIGARAELLNDLGSMQARAGKYADAQGLYEEALALKSSIFGEDSREAALVRMNLAVALEELGTYEAAIEQHDLALTALRAHLGPDHPSVGTALLNMAATEYRRGDLDAALQRYHDALRIKRASLGPDHPTLIHALDGVGLALRRLGRLDESRQYHRQAVELARRVSGSKSNQLGTALHNLGVVLKESGELQEARDVLTEVLDIWRPALGEAHPHVAIAMSNLAAIEGQLGHTASAVATLLQAREVFAASVPDHPQVAALTANLGRLQHDAGEFAKARAYYEEADATVRKTLPAGHPERLSVTEYLAELDIDEGKPAEAVAPLEAVLRARHADEDAAPVDLAHTRFALARALRDSGADRPRATELAAAARETIVAIAPADPLRPALDAWFDETQPK